MVQQNNFTRRQFLEATAAGGAACTIGALAGRPSRKIEVPVARIAHMGGVPTFICNDKPAVRPAFETYVPTRYYFEQFAEAGTSVFGFSTNSAACDYGHSKTTWIEADSWDYSKFNERAGAVLDVKPNALLLPRVNLGTPRWW